MTTPILEVKDLKQHFKVNRKFTVKAVDGISFTIAPGETYGLVGESGSGKARPAAPLSACTSQPPEMSRFADATFPER